MLNPNPNSVLIQALLDTGELLPPSIALDGITMTAAGPGAPPAPLYDASGWSLAVSDIGGRRSQGADALFAELSQAGGINADIGTWLNISAGYVISRFYAPPCVFGFAIQDGRFATPASFAPLTDSQFRQSIVNGVAVNNHLFGLGMQGGEASDSIRDMYRGEPGKTPFAVLDKAKEYDNTNWPALHLSFYDVAFYEILGGFKGAAYLGYNQPDPSKHITSHNVCDAFFDTRTDANWARYLRACARAMGATIPA